MTLASETKQGARPLVAFGPESPKFPSWNWIGVELAEELSHYYTTETFQEVPPENADVVVFVKFHPGTEDLKRLAQRSSILYCPVDVYGSATEIDTDWRALRSYTRVIVHCELLAKYFASYSLVEYIDHHVRFIGRMRTAYQPDGPIIWIGNRANLPPLTDWVNHNSLPEELWILTNPKTPGQPLPPTDYGFRNGNRVRVEAWTAERHITWTETCRAALDVKGDDFRQRHKPPAKAIDFIASGVPLAMNTGSSSVEHLHRLGFDVCEPEDQDRWLSREYWEETRQFGQPLRESLSRKNVGLRWCSVIDEVLAAQPQQA